ncbi:MAG: type II secretion system secretin GspD [Deltaproteobacteria bacterium]|nr:type II secretion system secretin GspD [Deltaproteobacteria bacterium]
MTAATVSGQVPPPPQPGSSYEELNVPKAVPVKPTAETRAAAPGATPGPGADEGLYLNAVDTDVREIIKQIAKVTGKNFLVDQSVRGKVTIISEKKMTIEEAYQAFLSALEVLGFTVVNAPGDLVKVIPMKEALQNPLPIYKDDSPVTDAFITRLIQMRNISALEMSNAVKTLVSKEGNLFAYPATNTLIVTDTGSNIDRLLKIMRELDQEGPSETIDIIPLRFAGAKDVANKINELYADDLKGKGAATTAAARRPAARGPELEETPYISKIIPDDRTNSVIVLASKRALTKVRELVARLDRKLEAGTEGKIHVHYLKHANAKDLAQVLSTLTASSVTASRQTAAGTPPGGATPGRQAAATEITAEFEGGVKIAPDENTNALIITATLKDYNTLAKEVIDKLDIPRKQVYVEVVIMELTIDKNRTLGVSGQGGGQFNLGGNPTLGFGSSLGGTAAGLSAAALSGLAAGVVSQTTQTIPVTNADGTVTNLEIPTFGVILNALQTDTDVNVLSTPNLLTLDNEEAEIVVGATQPFPSGTTLTPGGNTTFNVTREDVGIKLKMTPQINEGDVVKIKLKQEISSVVPGASETVLTSLGPTTTKRSVETVVAAKDQQTIVIGGLIDDKVTITTAKVPFLGDIPIFGNLFKNKKTTKAKTNILVFLRPFIIRDSKDFLKILQKKVEERNMFVSQNYGKGQQKVIRQSIRNHAADLLEFRRDIQRVDWEFQNDTGTRVVPIDTNPDSSGSSSGSRGSSDSSRLTDHDQQLLQAAQSDDAR